MDVTFTGPRLTRYQSLFFGGIFLAFVAAFAGVCVILTIVFRALDLTEDWPLWIQYGSVILTLGFAIPAFIVLSRTARETLEAQSKQHVDGLADITGPLPELSQPAPLDTVLQALLAINHKDLPYSVAVRKTRRGAKVSVGTRPEETRWTDALARGSSATSWQLVVTLRESNGTYHFGEFSTGKHVTQSATSLSMRWSWSWAVSLTGSFTPVSHIWSPKDLTQHGVNHVEGVRVRPTDMKMPVFAILRAHGWRPRWNNRFSELFEF
ncbi:hypothetical protein [Jonesia quinghaiensis]|uniref:hypothetical protein n=1 Tax=Jonesia quinghaiensis TaxID=262806 RepID=UPI0003F51F1B|nr:hypothetical protein [Jonesia quinghaiensis]